MTSVIYARARPPLVRAGRRAYLAADRMGHDSDPPHDPSATRPDRLAAMVRASRPGLRLWPAEGALVDGTYRVRGMLGEGGMGVVLLAHDERLQRDVAIKLIRPELAEAAHRARFLEEARAMARVRHPNVVEIHAFGELDGAPYFVMEYVAGSDLETFLAKRGGLLSPGEAHSVLLQLCRGVEAIHASGAVHRDLKASNVLVGDGFRVVIADLGLARTLDGAPVEGAVVSGTPGLHGAGDHRGSRPIRRAAPAGRRVLARRDRVRGPGGPAAVPRRHPAGPAEPDHGPAAAPLAAGSAGGLRARRLRGAGQGAGGPHPERDRAAPGARGGLVRRAHAGRGRACACSWWTTSPASAA
ncbi:MAG: serine/threonine protein kinase [Sandaracinaceae bacterium]|nr:serine/threonine protein kinase [Sandaracinaceae bacterium]